MVLACIILGVVMVIELVLSGSIMVPWLVLRVGVLAMDEGSLFF